MTGVRRRHVLLGVLSATVTFLVLAGSGGAWAYWSTQATAKLHATAATLSITSTGFENSAVGGSTGSVTLTNTTDTTSRAEQALHVSFNRDQASGGAELAAASTLTAWRAASSAACTAEAVPTGPVSGIWANGVQVDTTLAPGASVTYCLRTIVNVDALGSLTGTLAFGAQATATLQVGNFVTASTASTNYTQALGVVGYNWVQFARTAPNVVCLDVQSYAPIGETPLIGYTCHGPGGDGVDDSNQKFLYLDNGDGWGTIRPYLNTGLRVDLPVAPATGLVVRAASVLSLSQQWRLVPAGSAYQLQNRSSMLCLSVPEYEGNTVTQASCATETSDTASKQAQWLRTTIRAKTVLDQTHWFAFGRTDDRYNPNCWSVNGPVAGPWTVGNDTCASAATTDRGQWRWVVVGADLLGTVYGELRPRNDGGVLRISADALGSGVSVKQPDAVRPELQQWVRTEVGPGLYQLKNKATGLCASWELYGTMTQSACIAGAPNQVFKVIPGGLVG